MDTMIHVTDQFNWAFWLAFSFCIILDIVTLLIMYGIYLAWREKLRPVFKWFRNLIVIPFFMINIFLVLVFETVFVVGGVLTSDFCVDSPDEKVMLILRELSGGFDSFVVQQVAWYVTVSAGSSFSITCNTDTVVCFAENCPCFIITCTVSLHSLFCLFGRSLPKYRDVQARVPSLRFSLKPLPFSIRLSLSFIIW
jgi:hypothetical protein